MDSTATAPKTVLHLDELREHQVTDIEKIVPGAVLIFAHVPNLSNPAVDDHHVSAYGQVVTVVEVGEKTYAELHPKLRNIPGDDKPSLVVIYEDKSLSGFREESKPHRGYRHASDAGIVPYTHSSGGGGWYNGTNFTVLLSELEEKGFSALLETSESYDVALEEYNSKIVVWPDYSGDYYGYDSDLADAGDAVIAYAEAAADSVDSNAEDN